MALSRWRTLGRSLSRRSSTLRSPRRAPPAPPAARAAADRSRCRACPTRRMRAAQRASSSSRVARSIRRDTSRMRASPTARSPSRPRRSRVPALGASNLHGRGDVAVAARIRMLVDFPSTAAEGRRRSARATRGRRRRAWRARRRTSRRSKKSSCKARVTRSRGPSSARPTCGKCPVPFGDAFRAIGRASRRRTDGQRPSLLLQSAAGTARQHGLHDRRRPRSTALPLRRRARGGSSGH